MDNLNLSERKYTRRKLLGNITRFGAGAAALALLSPRDVKVVSAQVGQSEQIGTMVADVTEETAADFARGQTQNAHVAGFGADAMVQSHAGGEFVSDTVTLPFPATHLGLHWKVRDSSPEGLSVAVRASRNGHAWDAWQPLNIEAVADLSTNAESIPVHGHAESIQQVSAGDHFEVFASLVGVERANRVQYRVMFPAEDSASLESMTVTAINSTDGTQEISTMSVAKNVQLKNEAGIDINVITREGWGADETLRFNDGEKRWPEMYVPSKKVFLHHTATSNNYSDGAAQVRAIYTYHIQTLGFGDIGYNILVDRFGNIYEGRHGRVDESGREVLGDDVVAGHVFAYNYGTTGIAAIGDSQQGTWNRSWGDAGLKAIEDAVAFECGRQYLDLQGASDYLRSDEIWHAGELLHCAGHRDADGSGGSTACPGSRLYSYLNDTLRHAVAARLDGVSASALDGTQDGSNLTFNWTGADVYSLEGWYKAPGENDVTYLSGYDDPQSSEPRQTWDATADSDWQQTFGVSHPGHYTMHVRATSDDFAFAEHLTFRVTDITDPPPTGTITGIVMDNETGEGIEGANITVHGPDLVATTGADGTYTIEGVPVGTYDVTASAEHYQSSTVEGFVVDDGGTVDLNFALVPLDEESATTMHVAELEGSSSRQGGTWTATVTIKVVDNLGSPVSGATVKGDWSGGFEGSVSAGTDEDGICRVTSGSIPNRDQSVTFTVTSITNSLDYASGDNAASTVTVTR